MLFRLLVRGRAAGGRLGVRLSDEWISPRLFFGVLCLGVSGKSKGSESCIDPDMLGEARGFRTGVLFTGEELLYGNGDDDAGVEGCGRFGVDISTALLATIPRIGVLRALLLRVGRAGVPTGDSRNRGSAGGAWDIDCPAAASCISESSRSEVAKSIGGGDDMMVVKT